MVNPNVKAQETSAHTAGNWGRPMEQQQETEGLQRRPVVLAPRNQPRSPSPPPGHMNADVLSALPPLGRKPKPCSECGYLYLPLESVWCYRSCWKGQEIERKGLLQNNIVLGSALVDMHAKCGALEKAQLMIEDLPSQAVVCWSALIAGYVQHGQVEQALDCFERMQRESISPDVVTYACILKACGVIVAADKGKHIHDEFVGGGLLRDNPVLGSALVDMYARYSVLVMCLRSSLPSVGLWKMGHACQMWGFGKSTARD